MALATQERHAVPTLDQSLLTSPPEWISSLEAAQILQRSTRTVVRLGRAGLLTLNMPDSGCAARFRRTEVVELARRNGLDVS